MHYKNGRNAKEGDIVIGFDPYSKKVKAGMLFNLQPNDGTCNGMLVRIIPGTVQQDCVTLKELYHAEDAFLAIDSLPKTETPL